MLAYPDSRTLKLLRRWVQTAGKEDSGELKKLVSETQDCLADVEAITKMTLYKTKEEMLIIQIFAHTDALPVKTEKHGRMVYFFFNVEDVVEITDAWKNNSELPPTHADRLASAQAKFNHYVYSQDSRLVTE